MKVKMSNKYYLQYIFADLRPKWTNKMKILTSSNWTYILKKLIKNIKFYWFNLKITNFYISKK